MLSCLTDFFLEEALVRAKELDDFYEKTGQLVGPLHGYSNLVAVTFLLKIFFQVYLSVSRSKFTVFGNILSDSSLRTIWT